MADPEAEAENEGKSVERVAQSQRDYHHPYTPYDIQVQFMDATYDCIETGRVGIFESPTGILFFIFLLLVVGMVDDEYELC